MGKVETEFKWKENIIAAADWQEKPTRRRDDCSVQSHAAREETVQVDKYAFDEAPQYILI